MRGCGIFIRSRSFFCDGKPKTLIDKCWYLHKVTYPRKWLKRTVKGVSLKCCPCHWTQVPSFLIAAMCCLQLKRVTKCHAGILQNPGAAARGAEREWGGFAEPSGVGRSQRQNRLSQPREGQCGGREDAQTSAVRIWVQKIPASLFSMHDKAFVILNNTVSKI